MTITILRRDGSTIYTSEKPTLREALREAIDRKIDLTRANLTRANLTRANLADANLTRADLARANLAGADLTGVPVVQNIDAAILAAIEDGGKLEMSAWHGEGGICGTTHCRAGWAVHLAGQAGRDLENKVGPQRAGAMIYRASRPGKPAPWFFASDDEAMADIRKCAAEQTDTPAGA